MCDQCLVGGIEVVFESLGVCAERLLFTQRLRNNTCCSFHMLWLCYVKAVRIQRPDHLDLELDSFCTRLWPVMTFFRSVLRLLPAAYAQAVFFSRQHEILTCRSPPHVCWILSPPQTQLYSAALACPTHTAANSICINPDWRYQIRPYDLKYLKQQQQQPHSNELSTNNVCAWLVNGNRQALRMNSSQVTISEHIYLFKLK